MHPDGSKDLSDEHVPMLDKVRFDVFDVQPSGMSGAVVSLVRLVLVIASHQVLR